MANSAPATGRPDRHLVCCWRKSALADGRATVTMRSVEERLVVRATAAAASLAEAVNLQVNEAVIVQNSNKLALRLLPCDTFARTALVGQEVASFEVQVA